MNPNKEQKSRDIDYKTLQHSINIKDDNIAYSKMNRACQDTKSRPTKCVTKDNNTMSKWQSRKECYEGRKYYLFPGSDWDIRVERRPSPRLKCQLASVNRKWKTDMKVQISSLYLLLLSCIHFYMRTAISFLLFFICYCLLSNSIFFPKSFYFCWARNSQKTKT